MKYIIKILPIVILVILQCTLSQQAKLVTPYQSHSFNDLGQFKQLLVKGVRLFKMDMTLVPKHQCLELSSWKESDNACGFYDNKFMWETCCFGFRGDMSSLPKLRYPFNTTAEFLNIISDESNRYLFVKNSNIDRYQDPIFIAINQQNGDSVNDLNTAFLYNLFKIINDNNLNIVTSILTMADYQNKCYKTPQNCNEQENYVANQFSALQSFYDGEGLPPFPFDVVNPTNPSESMIQQFNTDFTFVDKLCTNGFPEWLTQYKFPIILWEPSFEYAAQYAYTKFNSPSCKKPKNYNPQQNNLIIASNQNPEFLQSFLQAKNQTLSEQFGQKLAYQQTTDPVLGFSQKSEQYYMALKQLNTDAKQQYIIKTMTQDGSGNYVLQSEIAFEEQVLKIKTADDFIFVEFQTYYQVFQNSLSKSVFKEIKSNLYVDADIIFSSNEPLLIILSKQAKQQSQLLVYFYKFMGQKAQFCQSQLSGDFSNIDLANLDCMGAIDNQNQVNAVLQFSKINYKDYTVQVEEIFASTLVFTQVNTPECSLDQNNGPSKISFGTRPRGNAYFYDGRTYIVSTYGNSKCEGGALQNNNDWNKCNFEDFAPLHNLLNTDYLLSYFYGDFESIQQRVIDNKVITSCDSEILVGKYYNGSGASVALKVGQDQSVKVVVAHSYVNYKDLTLASTLTCGSEYIDSDYETNSASLLYSFDTVEFSNMVQNTKFNTPFIEFNKPHIQSVFIE